MSTKYYYQTVSINRNSKALKKIIMDYLRKEWSWDADDFNEGMSETRYSLSFELMSDEQEELKTDVNDLLAFINSVKKNGRTYCSTIKCE